MAIEDVLKLKEMDDVDISIDTKLDLYPYQKVGSLFMYMVKKCFVLDDPGLGKTAETIGFIKLLQAYEGITNVKVLVVTSSSIIYQWRDEIKKFSNLIPVVIDGGKKRRENTYTAFNKGRQNIMIMNYSKINFDFEYISHCRFDVIVFDEASSLKDQASKSYKLFNMITQNVHRIVMLTATPISNNLEEFYNLFQLFHMDYLPPYEVFRDHFLETKDVMVKKNGRKFTIKTVVGSKNISEFKKMVEPFFIRRENKEEGDFKNFKLFIEKVPILMSMEQKETLTKLKMDHFKDEDSVVLRVFSDFTKVSCCPHIYSEDLSWFSPKALELIKLIKRLNTKVVVFAKFIEYHKILQYYLTSADISFVSITGEQKPKEKEENKNAFREDPNVTVMLLTGAGKFGLNLQVANKIIFVDMPFTPSDVFQYIGRVYRTGQQNDVTSYFLYHENSLEEDLFMSLYRKQKEIDEFFDQDKADIFKLHFDSDVDVKVSFMSRDYNSGPFYEDNLTEDEAVYLDTCTKLAEEKKEEISVTEEDNFFKVDIFNL